jgi:ribonuclease BN (tRNA processing enzyme)
VISVRFLGSGNAFADGGRSHACIHVGAPGVSILLDCGAASLPTIKRYVDPAKIDAIAVTHLHGDHFGGIPFFLDEQKWAGRRTALAIAGPPSLRSRLELESRAFGIGLTREYTGFDVSFAVLGRDEQELAGARVAAYPVRHSPAAEPHGLRVRADGKLIAYSGDAAWSEELVELARGADLFICEATLFAAEEEQSNPVHVSYQTLVKHRARFECGRMILTHLGATSLAHLAEFELPYATDGLELTV